MSSSKSLRELRLEMLDAQSAHVEALKDAREKIQEELSRIDLILWNFSLEAVELEVSVREPELYAMKESDPELYEQTIVMLAEGREQELGRTPPHWTGSLVCTRCGPKRVAPEISNSVIVKSCPWCPHTEKPIEPVLTIREMLA